MKQLTDKQMIWIMENESLLNTSKSATETERQEVYVLFNWINSTNKKPNSCGRCWMNVKKAVYQQFLKQTKIF